MNKYCLGFIFDSKLQKVLLVKKNRSPKGVEVLVGKLNGIGGHTEENETSLESMKREGIEEADLDLEWTQFLTLRARFGHVDCFYSVTDKVFDFAQKEDEELEIYDIDETAKGKLFLKYYKNYPRMTNLDYMIPMIINHYKKLDETDVFIVTETYK